MTKGKLTPKIAGEIWKSIQKRNYDAQVSKDAVLHHLKQLKAQMGKLKKAKQEAMYHVAITECMTMIDKKISKLKK